MGIFNLTALERAQRYMEAARKDLQEAEKNCRQAREWLENAGRATEGAAMGMVCASVHQSQRDVIQWRELTSHTRENQEPAPPRGVMIHEGNTE